MDRRERAQAYKNKLNGKFREGDRVAYTIDAVKVSGLYQLECTGIITVIEDDDLWIQRDRSIGRVDQKKTSEVRKA